MLKVIKCNLKGYQNQNKEYDYSISYCMLAAYEKACYFVISNMNISCCE
jgi:hypothetical protein